METVCECAPLTLTLKNNIKLLAALTALFITCTTKAQVEKTVVSQCLQDIHALQLAPARGMTEGLFTTHRRNLFPFSKNKIDNNAFYTGLVVNILRVYKDSLKAQDRVLAEQMVLKALPAFEKFKHRKGKPSYYFWPVDTPRHFPNSFLERISSEKRYLPDDADCSAILLEAASAPDADLQKAHVLFQDYAATDTRKAVGTLKKYRRYRAYSTWLGYAIPVDFDMCVHANILRFVDKNNLAWSATDSATAGLLLTLVKDKKHLRMPRFVAPYYGRTSIILFHLARWMVENKNGWMEPVKTELIAETKALLKKTKSPLETVLLRTALNWWGADDNSPVEINLEKLRNDKLAYFRGNVGAYLPSTFKRVADRLGLFTFNFYCPGFNEALLLQYALLSNNVKTTLQ